MSFHSFANTPTMKQEEDRDGKEQIKNGFATIKLIISLSIVVKQENADAT